MPVQGPSPTRRQLAGKLRLFPGTHDARRHRSPPIAAASNDGSPAPRPTPPARRLGPPPSRLERFFAAHEFTTPHMLSCSDVEALTLGDLLALAGPGAADGVYGPSLSLGYTHPAGSLSLRADVAAMLASDAAAVAPAWGGGPLSTAPLDPDSIFCAAPQELAGLCVTAALEQAAAGGGRPSSSSSSASNRPRVLATAPAYPGLVAVAVGLGAEVVPWRPRWDEGGPAFEVADLRSALAAGGPPPALAVLNFPHSPTGASLSPADFRAALAACAAAGVCTVLVDELYRLPGAGLPPAVCAAAPPSAAGTALISVGGLSAAGGAPCVCSLGGLSKWAGLPGLRAGWLACSGPGGPALLCRMGELRDHGTVCGSAPAEALARLGVRSRALLAARAGATLAANAAAAARFFGPHGGSHAAYFDFYAPPPGAPVCFPALATGEAAAAWAERARAGAGVLVLPGDTFELAGDGDGRRFRLGLGRAGFGAALEALGAWLDRGEALRVV